MIDRIAIFGATGDLTSRYLIPALVELRQAGKLPAEFRIIGIATDEWDTERFRRHIAGRLENHAPGISAEHREAILSVTEYRRADVTDREAIARAIGMLGRPLVAYLALPPSLFSPVIEALAELNLPSGCSIVIEKPFGEDLASAGRLNRLLAGNFAEEHVFRIDSFLGKQTVYNILGLRFANRIFEPVWNARHVRKVEIAWDETLGLEGRALYYDRAGALKDMIQNHLLQLLAVTAMEPPRSIGGEDFRDRKAEVLRAVRRLSPAEAARLTIRGRYSAGSIGDREIPSYVDENGVDPGRRTETFAAAALFIDNDRWNGVPFVLRSGKALGKERREIALSFKPESRAVFAQGPGCGNVLRIELNPDRISLRVNIAAPCDTASIAFADLDQELTPQCLSDYARLLLDVLEGNPGLFIRGDEAEESWRIVEPIVDAWSAEQMPLLEYPAGSNGPVMGPALSIIDEARKSAA
jgi:glucose-6-phosphate 1-dehydrogenase